MMSFHYVLNFVTILFNIGDVMALQFDFFESKEQKGLPEGFRYHRAQIGLSHSISRVDELRYSITFRNVLEK